MKVYNDIGIEQFQAWSGAVQTLNKIIEANKADEFTALIEELYPNGIDETALNDILWFDSEWCLETLGISDESEDEE